MSRKRYSVEQIINHLREAEVLLARGQRVGEICRRIGVSPSRDRVAAKMTPEQIAEAQRLAQEWKPRKRRM